MTVSGGISGRACRPRVRVMLVDDHEMFRAALRSALATRDWIELTAEAASGEQAVQLIEAERPDIVLMDFSMPGMGGLAATRKIAGSSNARVIALSVQDSDAHAQKMRRAGAWGWVTKHAAFDELVAIIDRVAAGASGWDPTPR